MKIVLPKTAKQFGVFVIWWQKKETFQIY